MFKKAHVIVFAFLVTGTFCFAQDKPIQIVLLGSYHLSGMTPDKIKVKGDSILGDKRQQEISEIVNQLAYFNPQHIFVEATEKAAPILQIAYDELQQGIQPKRRGLAMSEIFQFGIKTASRIKLSQGVTPVDWQQPFISDTSKALSLPFEEAYRQYWRLFNIHRLILRNPRQRPLQD